MSNGSLTATEDLVILSHVISVSVPLPDADLHGLVHGHPPLLQVGQPVREEPGAEGLVRLGVDGRDVERA